MASAISSATEPAAVARRCAGRRATVWAGSVITGLAAMAAYAAWVSTPYWWPLPVPYRHLGRLAHLLSSLSG
jgi:hypothetical protein